MKAEEREIRRKRRVLEHAVESGNVAKTCRYFGVPRSSFYRWRNVYLEHGEEGLRSKKPIAKSHPNQTPDEIVEKILYLAEILSRTVKPKIFGPLTLLGISVVESIFLQSSTVRIAPGSCQPMIHVA